jgi:hypothetical protein
MARSTGRKSKLTEADLKVLAAVFGFDDDVAGFAAFVARQDKTARDRGGRFRKQGL